MLLSPHHLGFTKTEFVYLLLVAKILFLHCIQVCNKEKPIPRFTCSEKGLKQNLKGKLFNLPLYFKILLSSINAFRM